MLYDLNFFKKHASAIPVISVGNLSFGGTGKTPFVIYIAKLLVKKNLNPLIVSRGYKRSSKEHVLFNGASGLTSDEVGDEPLMISRELPGIDILVNKNKLSSIRWAQKFKSKYNAIIIDDGFQMRSIKKALDIVLVDSKQSTKMLPWGTFREPFKNIKRADCVVYTKNPPSKNLEKKINRAGVLSFKCTPSFSLSNKSCKQGISFCGIGSPSFFIKTLERLSIKTIKHITFKDHQKYTEKTLKKIEKTLSQCSQKTFFTTHKDWIKLPRQFIKKYEGCYVKMSLQIEEGPAFEKILTNKTIGEN
tara:strand:+ start:26383 stop:27294 length:912 start_codon:yes stop_codon:yes gene_type:complete